MKSSFVLSGWFFSLALAFLSATSPVLGAQAPASDIRAKKTDGKLRIVATPASRHHFNVDAPNQAISDGARSKPVVLSEQSVEFEFPATEPRELKLTLYVCDDAKTFCERQESDASWTGSELKVNVPPAKSPPAALKKGGDASPHSASLPKKDLKGFYLNEPEAALAEARKKGLPILIDFFGIWCPPCNELDEKVFSSKEFKAAAKDFVKLKLDADMPVSWPLKSKFKVGGYPTIVFASSEAEEISRIVGSRTKQDFVRELTRAWAARNLNPQALRTRAESGDAEAAERLGKIHLERREYEEALKYLAKSPKSRWELRQAEIGALEAQGQAQDTAGKLKLIEAYQKTIWEFPARPESLLHGESLAKLLSEQGKSEEAKAAYSRVIADARRILKQPDSLKGTEWTRGDVASTIASALEARDGEASARLAWAQAAEEYRKDVSSDASRGSNQNYAYCLRKAGRFDEAERIYRRLQKAYPDEFTFYYELAHQKFAQKNYREAEEQATLALRHAYGDNRLRVVHLLARSFKEQGQAAKALPLLQDEIREAKVPEDPGVRTHRYIQALRDLQAELKGSS